MWVCSVLGFFSVVAKGGPGKWSIRARERRDLENLVKEMGKPKPKIIRSPINDYRFRIIVGAGQLTEVFAILEKSIDYQNFKSEVARHPDQAHKLPIYHRIWADMLSVHRESNGKKSSSGDAWFPRDSLDVERLRTQAEVNADEDLWGGWR